MAPIYKYEKWTVGTASVYRYLNFIKQPPEATTNSSNGWYYTLPANGYTNVTVDHNNADGVTYGGTSYSPTVANSLPIGTILYLYNDTKAYHEVYIREDYVYSTKTFYWRPLLRWSLGKWKDTFVEYVYGYENSYPYDGFGLNDNYWYVKTSETRTVNNEFVLTNANPANAGYIYSTASISHTYMSNELVSSAYLSTSYLTLTNVTIPKGSVIDLAMLKITPNEKYANQYAVDTEITAENIGNSVVPTTNAAVKSKMSNKTVANALWKMGITYWYTQYEYFSPDIKSIIQAIINRSDWVPGNNITLILDTKNVDSSSYPRRYNITPTIYIAYTPPKVQIGTFPFTGKSGIINIPLYDESTVTNKAYRAYTASGKVGCFDVQDLTGNELIRMTCKTKIRGIKR